MTLNPLAIATQGVPYSPLQISAQGLLPQDASLGQAPLAGMMANMGTLLNRS